jgi:hypothetical protein
MWLDRYVMTPFKDGGRDFNGVDCQGGYMLLLANEKHVALPEPGVSYGKDPKAVRSYIEAQMHSGEWELIAEGNGAAVKDKAVRFDLVVMSATVRVGASVIKSDVHVGCALGDGKLIHWEQDVGATVLRLDDPDIINRVKAVYRPKALCEAA